MTTTTAGRVYHGSITLERTYRASPARVFEAWRSVEARQRWSRPSDEIALVYDSADFRVGGEDVARCGTAGDMRHVAKVRYLEIVDDRLIVFSEHVSEAGVSKAAALVHVSLTPEGRETRLSITMQVASFDSPDMIEGYRQGWTPTLEKLATEF